MHLTRTVSEEDTRPHSAPYVNRQDAGKLYRQTGRGCTHGTVDWYDTDLKAPFFGVTFLVTEVAKPDHYFTLLEAKV